MKEMYHHKRLRVMLLGCGSLILGDGVASMVTSVKGRPTQKLPKKFMIAETY
jgi:hypothetical protein